MKNPFVLFWCVLIFSSIGWYAFLVFYVGIKAGQDIRVMMRSLEASLKASQRDEHKGRE